MDNLQTITAISKALGISNRMLRYYEQVGLVQSQRIDGYAYRVYNDAAVRRLRQIIVLRKLRISVKQIRVILNDSDAVKIIEIFERNISELDEEMTALSTVRSILTRLVSELQEKVNVQVRLDWLSDSSALSLAEALSLPQNTLREEKTMSELSQADQKLSKLTDKNVRIIHLPPAAVAAYQYVGDEPEMHVNQVVDQFVRESHLTELKPDLRHFGFNTDKADLHGYEMWVTIPDDMEVPEPLVKRRFEGGLYAAHMIPFGAFDEWGLLCKWVQSSEKYQGNSSGKGAECMWGLLEEHLNYANHVYLDNSEPEDLQLDLLHPIKLR